MHKVIARRIISDVRKLSKEADRCEGKTTQQIIKEMGERKYRKIRGRRTYAVISKKKIGGRFIVGKGANLRTARKRYIKEKNLDVNCDC